jgi:chromosome segregation ATPase
MKSMSEEQIATLQKEKNDLENQLSQAVSQANDYVLQLDVRNAFLSETIGNNLENRAHLSRLNTALQDSNQKLNSSTTMIADLNHQLTIANEKITKLETKITALISHTAVLEVVESSEEDQKSA